MFLKNPDLIKRCRQGEKTHDGSMEYNTVLQKLLPVGVHAEKYNSICGKIFFFVMFTLFVFVPIHLSKLYYNIGD